VTAPVRSTFTSAGSVEQVLAILTSEQWAATRAERLRDGARLITHDVRADGSVLAVSSRTLPDGVPGFLQRFLPADGRVLETFDWAAAQDGRRAGTWRVEIPGAPATLGGQVRLEPSGSGSTYTIEGDVQVKVPLVGGKAETFIAGMVERLAAKEADLLIAEVEAR
jgi:hypothetical protein